MEPSRKVILVPVDFGDASEKALEVAQELAGKLDAKIIVLHVHLPPVVAYPELPPTIAERLYTDTQSAAERSLHEIATEHPGIQTMLRMGDPTTEILEAITAERPMIVAMGTHGRRGLKRFFLGSVAERVVSRSPVPVVTVRVPDTK